VHVGVKLYSSLKKKQKNYVNMRGIIFFSTFISIYISSDIGSRVVGVFLDPFGLLGGFFAFTDV